MDNEEIVKRALNEAIRMRIEYQRLFHRFEGNNAEEERRRKDKVFIIEDILTGKQPIKADVRIVTLRDQIDEYNHVLEVLSK